MFRTVAMTVLALGPASLSDVVGNVVAGEQNVQEQSAKAEGPEAQARQRARQTLAQHLKVDAAEITVTQAEPRTWSNSSMGCGKPGTASLTVMTEGYAVSLAAQGREYRVHVSGNSATVCDQALRTRQGLHRPVHARGLDVMMEQARQDLAQRLGVEVSTVRIAGMQPQRWANSGLDCPVATEPVVEGPVKGYRLSLGQGPRVYTYHTDMKKVRPCPAIESE